MLRCPPPSTLFPYTTLFRSIRYPAPRYFTTLNAIGEDSSRADRPRAAPPTWTRLPALTPRARSEEHTSELQSRRDLVCRLLLEKKKQDVDSVRADPLRSYTQ